MQAVAIVVVIAAAAAIQLPPLLPMINDIGMCLVLPRLISARKQDNAVEMKMEHLLPTHKKGPVAHDRQTPSTEEPAVAAAAVLQQPPPPANAGAKSTHSYLTRAAA